MRGFANFLGMTFFLQECGLVPNARLFVRVVGAGKVAWVAG